MSKPPLSKAALRAQLEAVLANHHGRLRSVCRHHRQSLPEAELEPLDYEHEADDVGSTGVVVARPRERHSASTGYR